MKFLKIIVLAVVISNSFYVNGQISTFQNMYYGQNGEFTLRGFEFIQTPDSGYLIGGRENLVKCNKDGSLEWLKRYSNPTKIFSSFEYHENAGFYVAESYFLERLDSNGNILWGKNYNTGGTGGSYSFSRIRFMELNDYILGGQFYLPAPRYFMLTSVDSSGAILWNKGFRHIANIDNFKDLDITLDKAIVVCGTNDTSIGTNFISRGVVFKTDSLGNQQWNKLYSNAPNHTFFYSIIATSDSCFIITGITYTHFVIIKLDANGNELWNKYYSTGIDGSCTYITEFDNNHLLVTGMISGVDSIGFYERPYIMKLDLNGNVLWSKRFDNFIYSIPGFIKKTMDGGIAIGVQIANPSGGTSIGLIKVDSSGNSNDCIVNDIIFNESTVGFNVYNSTLIDTLLTFSESMVSSNPSLIGTTIDLCQTSGLTESADKFNINIFPNPNNGDFIIELINESPVSLELIDMQGKSLYLDKFNQKEIKINFQSKLETGMYVLKMVFENNAVIRKPVVIFEN